MDLQKYTNVEFLRPLISEMTYMNPEGRPTAEVALRKWSDIRRQIPLLHREWRPHPSDERSLVTLVLDVISLYQLSINLAKASVQGLYGR